MGWQALTVSALLDLREIGVRQTLTTVKETHVKMEGYVLILLMAYSVSAGRASQKSSATLTLTTALMPTAKMVQCVWMVLHHSPVSAPLAILATCVITSQTPVSLFLAPMEAHAQETAMDTRASAHHSSLD